MGLCNVWDWTLLGWFLKWFAIFSDSKPQDENSPPNIGTEEPVSSESQFANERLQDPNDTYLEDNVSHNKFIIDDNADDDKAICQALEVHDDTHVKASDLSNRECQSVSEDGMDILSEVASLPEVCNNCFVVMVQIF